MRKLLIAALTLTSLSAFAAPAGSSEEFMFMSIVGFNEGCSELNSGDSNLRHMACNYGKTLRLAGVSNKQMLEILKVANKQLPKIKSLCQ